MILFILLFIVTGAAIEGKKEVCYGALGCFSNEGPFLKSRHRPVTPLPKSPAEIDMKFLLFSPNGSSSGAELKTNDPSSLTSAKIDVGLPYIFVVHGFKSYGKSPRFLKVS